MMMDMEHLNVVVFQTVKWLTKRMIQAIPLRIIFSDVFREIYYSSITRRTFVDIRGDR